MADELRRRIHLEAFGCSDEPTVETPWEPLDYGWQKNLGIDQSIFMMLISIPIDLIDFFIDFYYSCFILK